jgi:hypothetical protein
VSPVTACQSLRAVVFVGLFGATASLAQAPIAARPLGPITVRTTEPIGCIAGFRRLSTGRVLVADGCSRRLLLLDSMLAHPLVIADTTSGTHKAYVGRGALIPYRADSTLFVDPTSLSFLVVDPRGTIVRVMAMPNPTDAGLMTQRGAGIDQEGRLVYAGRPRNSAADSTAVLRVDLLTRRIDTAMLLGVPGRTNITLSAPDGTRGGTFVINPIPVGDAWALLPDGSVASIRELDYHVDWLNRDGTRTSSPKIDFEWIRIPDVDKVHLIDSLKAADSVRRSQLDSVQRRGIMGFASMFVDPSTLPDYRPPFSPVETPLVDADGNIWIRISPPASAEGGPVYDVINRAGARADRVQLPGGCTLVGFGATGIVYIQSREGTGYVIASARLR